MKICVLGLWHLGSVTAACLASGGHFVTGLDFDEQVIENLGKGIPPLFEPGLEELVKKGIAEKKLDFTTDTRKAVSGANVIWVTYDTPVDENDRADVDYVVGRVARLFPDLESGQQILISSQLPVGSVRRLEASLAESRPNLDVSFSCSPENLRLGKAITVFTQPDRVVVGVRNDESKRILSEVLSPFTDRIEWMSVESAEMTKHALNAFLATSVTFINEIAVICEQVGADAKEVERGLKSESRIGPKAYLGPGGAFAGGTLARDVAFLTQLGKQYDVPIQLFPAIKSSNDAHKNWARRRLIQLLGDINGKTVAVWGLTYKPGTDTLRRSSAVELCKWLLEQGVHVRAHDPAVKKLPEEFKQLPLAASALEAVQKADALVIATEWPEYRQVDMTIVLSAMNTPYVLDVNRFLAKNVEALPAIKYVTVGKSVK
ncbi:MAG: UDP-glucose/GDP-mannose dehydrogenase family protein [Anaerolineales bacterium]|nr:UDP-glucose/GDP-mannose dehydrogenase family protein [Anaerolineales bacterium]